MAKDLGVMPGGKKEELIQRLQACSASGWATPLKRKSDPEASETPLTVAKRSKTATASPKALATVVPLGSPSPRRSHRRIKVAEVVEECPQKDPLSEDDPSTEEGDALNEEKSHDKALQRDPEQCPQKDRLSEDNPSTEEGDALNEEKSHDQPLQRDPEQCPQKDRLSEDEPSTEEDDALNEEKSHDQPLQRDPEVRSNDFDDYLIFGNTSAFITGDDLLAMVDQVPVTTLTLWKVTPTLTECDKQPLHTVDRWIIPSEGGDQIQNVTAFKEAYKDVLETLRELKAADANGRNEAPDGVITTDDAQPSKRRWYEVCISRNLGKGALAVTLIKGTVEGKGICPRPFWLSGLSAARQDDSETLEHEAKLLF
ncbi:hypothetical protein JB92DRAFT_431859 [Gautieria morchelliformis]|nr:hypothetical protein JB92DRAFT_431859 [Gautieria morchelliformis]